MFKKYISPFIVGFGSGVLQIVPMLKGISCCLLIPIAAYLSLMLDQKATKDYSEIKFKKAAVFGLLTGLFSAIFATLFEIIITLITHNNDIVIALPEVVKMLQGFPVDESIRKEILNLLSGIVYQIKNYGFSFFYSISILVNNLVINTIFGLIGGIISMQILNKKNRSQL